MSNFREQGLPIHSPIGEPVASDGSPLSVIRDVQGEIREASGTGHDGVFRRLIITRKQATNPAGFHFLSTQLDFFEQGKEYLRLGSVLSPDAGKASVQVYSGTSQFGLAVGVPRKGGQASVITSTGGRANVDLSQVSLHSSSPVPASAVHGTLPPPAPGIQEALKKTGYFQPLFEQEHTRFVAQLEAVLHPVNLSTEMHADVLVSRFEGTSSEGGRPSPDTNSSEERKKATAKTVALSGLLGLLAGGLVALGLGLASITGSTISLGTLIGVVTAVGVFVGVATVLTLIVLGTFDPPPPLPSVTVGADDTPPPAGTNDTPPTNVVPQPLPPPIPPPPSDAGTPSDDTQQPQQDGEKSSETSQTQPDVSAWQDLPDGGWTSTTGATPAGEGPSGSPSGPGGGDVGSGSGGGPSGEPSGGSGSSSSDSGPSGSSGPGGSGQGESGGGSDSGSNGSESGGNSGGESGGGSSGGESGGGGGGGGESIGTGGVLKKPENEGDESSGTSGSTSSTPKRPPEPPPTI